MCHAKSPWARLVAAYALGSLAHGGFSPLVSDVDLGVVLADPLLGSDSDTMEQVAGGLKRRGTVLHERLSVFWGTRKTLRGEQVGGRFPPMDVLDLIQNGKLLAGRDARSDLPQPTPVDLFVAGAEFALGCLVGIDVTDAHRNQSLGSMRPADCDTVEQLRRPELLLAQGVRRVTKLVLFPVRFLFTAETGLVGTNESAVAHFLTATGAPSTDLVAAALTWRRDPPEPAQAGDLLQRGTIPLYRFTSTTTSAASPNWVVSISPKRSSNGLGASSPDRTTPLAALLEPGRLCRRRVGMARMGAADSEAEPPQRPSSESQGRLRDRGPPSTCGPAQGVGDVPI